MFKVQSCLRQKSITDKDPVIQSGLNNPDKVSGQKLSTFNFNL